jgi:hypothetical protein
MAVIAGRGHREQSSGERQPCYSFITLDGIELDSVCYEDDSEEDTRGVRTLQNLHKYSIKSAIFNFAAVWKEIKTTTLANGWIKLLQDTEPEKISRVLRYPISTQSQRGQGMMLVKVTLNSG